jgi:hypothetical protein
MQQQQQPIQQQQFFSFGDSYSSPGHSSVRLIPNPKCKDTDEVVAVIVTICGGSTYDEMFTAVPQESPSPGTRIAVYQVTPESIKELHPKLKMMSIKKFSDESNQSRESKQKRSNEKESKESKESKSGKDKTKGKTPLEQLCLDIQDVDADSVVFNWECCSGCSENGFHSDSNSITLPFMETIIEHGHMVMVSDFSLKALIAKWQSNTAPKLGPNPFIQLGTCSNSFTLQFEPKVLSKCPSAQLQKVGDLMQDKGTTQVHAMSNTIVYSVDKAVADNNHYKYQVLTVVSGCEGFNVNTADKKHTHSANKQKGVCGHVLLEYRSGGRLLASCGHWIELLKLDVNEAQLLQVAQREYGDAYFQDLQADLNKCTDNRSRASMVQSKAAYMVQSSCPQEMSKGFGRVKGRKYF